MTQASGDKDNKLNKKQTETKTNFYPCGIKWRDRFG